MLKNYSLFLLFFFITCTNSEEPKSTSTDQAGLSTELPTGFHTFYDQFHSDSVFQVDHVVFPLKGEITKIDSMETLAVEKIYTKDEWKLHQPFNSELGFNRSFTVLGDLVIEKMQDDMSLLTIERRWGKVDSTWSLIYYGTTEKSW